MSTSYGKHLFEKVGTSDLTADDIAVKLAHISGFDDIYSIIDDIYMLEYKKRYVKPTTYINYTVKVKNHINPAIGHYKLKALRQDIIQKFVNCLSDKGLAPSTVIDV